MNNNLYLDGCFNISLKIYKLENFKNQKKIS